MGRVCHPQYVTREKKDQKHVKTDQLFPVHSNLILGLL